MELAVNDTHYRVEFRHLTKIHSESTIKAVTTCVVIDGHKGLTLIDNALCVYTDNFCRRDGRLTALAKVLERGPLKEIKGAFLAEYLKLDPPPVWHAPKPKVKLPPERVEELKAAGEDVRHMRRMFREVTS